MLNSDTKNRSMWISFTAEHITVYTEPVDTGPAAAMSSTTSATATISSGAPYGEDETKLPEDVCQCENCGVYGMVSEFCGGGRFCSKTCVGQYASK